MIAWCVTPTVEPQGPRGPGHARTAVTAETHSWTTFTPDEIVDAVHDVEILNWLDSAATTSVALEVTGLLHGACDGWQGQLADLVNWLNETRAACHRRFHELVDGDRA